jgi:signal transduction histidine kinase
MQPNYDKEKGQSKPSRFDPMISRLVILGIAILEIVRLIAQGDTWSIVLLVIVIALFVFTMSRRAEEVLAKQNTSEELLTISAYNLQLLEQLSEIDTQTRRDLGSWLHSVVQPKLLSIARKAWNDKSEIGITLTTELDELNDNVVRKYSHQLFPVQLEISLALALADMLEGRAEFSFDTRMVPLMGDMGEPGPVPKISPEAVKSLIPKSQVFFTIQQRYAIYRIVEEAVANAEKKPSTTKISVDISIPEDQIIISVIDNGSPAGESIKFGLGTRLIDTFTLLHKGSWKLSNISTGVEFRCVFPVITEVAR